MIKNTRLTILILVKFRVRRQINSQSAITALNAAETLNQVAIDASK